MSDIAIPVVVLSPSRDHVELYNKTLRGAGHAVRCKGLSQFDQLESVLEEDSPHLLIFFADGHSATIRDVAGLRDIHSPMSPLIVIVGNADEEAIAAALRAGAQDLVSVDHLDRICSVSLRELKAFRNARSLHDALHSAMQYKKQLKSLLSNSADAFAVVQEGIVVEANQAWADLFAGADTDAALGPLMDQIADASQASLKAALVALGRGQAERNTLSVEARDAGGKAFQANLNLEVSTHDGEPAVRLSIERERAADAASTAEALVEQTLHTDLATGFLQRRQFLELLAEKLDQKNRDSTRTLVFVRPDKFDEIERDLGPVSSEEVIGQIAAVLDGLMGESDLGGRFGGKVLALVLERRELRDIAAWAENALVRIGNSLFEVADRSLSLTCSIGLAELSPETDCVEDLIRNADRALNDARNTGGNRCVVEECSDESTRIKRIDEIRIRQIKAALIDGRFRLMHLNIASLSGRAERMFDSYVRLMDEQGDEIAASEFMETAGRNGLLRAVDRWVIDATLEFCAAQASDLVFVKLSHESVLDTSLWSWVEERTGKSGIKPGRLCFQVTEENASKFQKQTGALAESLRRRGFRFAIEQFGTGRDPLRVLGSTPMDFVKFDGSLCKNLATETADQEKIRTFVASATQRDIKTIATHVENANTMAVLFQLGVAYMQGHYLHEPEVVLEAML